MKSESFEFVLCFIDLPLKQANGRRARTHNSWYHDARLFYTIDLVRLATLDPFRLCRNETSTLSGEIFDPSRDFVTDPSRRCRRDETSSKTGEVCRQIATESDEFCQTTSCRAHGKSVDARRDFFLADVSCNCPLFNKKREHQTKETKIEMGQNKMKTFRITSVVSMFLCYLISAIFLALIDLGCKTKSPVQVSSSLPALPALTDQIPFDKLGQGKLVFQRFGPPDNNYGGIYVVDIDHQRSWGIGDNVYDGPAVSPDGQKIAYTTCTAYSGPCDSIVYIMNIDGTGSQCVCDLEGWKHSPSWTPDGKQILFSSCLFSTYGYLLYRQSPVQNPSDRTVIIDFNRVKPPYVYVPDGPVSVSPNGKMAVSVNGIWAFDSDGSNIKMTNGDLYSSVWSPDGKTLAALSVPHGSSRNMTAKVSVSVMLFDSVGAGSKTLVTLSATGTAEWYGDNSNSLCWSPDGSKLAFTRPDGVEFGAHIYLINRDGTGLTQVTTAAGVTDRSLSWSR